MAGLCEDCNEPLGSLKGIIQNSTMPPTGSPSRASGNLKIRSKNYASPDCGAKIVGTNPEAMYAGSIISPSRDEYVLNACSNRFWFVVELCEAIQAKKIELANFELFSSSPRDFSVSLSDRFPSRDWRSVGHFTAKDERDIQSFNLDPHLFGKFIKVELHSHYGSEHYCPISLFRVYGTSEFEVLETEVEVHESVPNMADDDDDEEPLDVDTGEPPKTLFGSAQDAVMSIVKKAAQALVKSGDLQNDTTTSENVDMSHSNISERENCVSPSHIVVCDNCSDAMFNQVFGLLSCRGAYLQSLIDTPFVRSSFQTSRLCVEYGFDFSSHRTGAPYPLRPSANGVHPLRLDRSSYLSALLPPEYIAALLDSSAAATTVASQIKPTKTLVKEPDKKDFPSAVPIKTSCDQGNEATVIADSSSVQELPASVPSSVTISISPGEENKTGTSSEAIKESAEPTKTTLPSSGSVKVDTTQELSSTSEVEQQQQQTVGSEKVGDVLLEEKYQESQDSLSLDSFLLSELKDLDMGLDSSSSALNPSITTTVTPPSLAQTQQVQKESVFVRLSNRIKLLLWVRLKERRTIYSLFLLFRIMHTSTLNYLLSRFQFLTTLRNRHQALLFIPHNRISLYSSFFTSVVRNSLNRAECSTITRCVLRSGIRCLMMSGTAGLYHNSKLNWKILSYLMLFRTAVVFPFVDTASAELQASSSPSHHIGFIRWKKNDNLSVLCVNKIQILSPPMSVEDDTFLKETSKTLSMGEEDDKIFQKRINRKRGGTKRSKLKQEKIHKLLEKTRNFEAIKEIGLEVNPEKTKYMIMSCDQNIFRTPQCHLLGVQVVQGNLKIRSKNYASPDCGAKIVGTNPEAMYAGSIISPSRDEYVLNACSTVSGLLWNFARPFSQEEHYCPISLFRVYGTSEFEVLETEVEVHESVSNMADDDDDEEPLDVDTGEPPKTLFGSARCATVIADSSSVQELPASVPSSVTISISPGEENKTGTSSEAIKESAELTKTTLPSSGSVKVDYNSRAVLNE
ncbi:hypothetical protein ANN_00836 [Periplaneta americana]|uniref:SUN domain-containing protein n=1 Tax=Periplaneta americana TaxID=6978 RepID=A0ABQ8TTP7_PERAM|nr:hypothetical protein ANN_00836 [Periplaneta americana]